MREDLEGVDPLLDEMIRLMERLERGANFEDSLGPDHAKLGSFCSRRRERLQVKAPLHPIVALILDGGKRFGAGRRARRGEMLVIPVGGPIQVVNVPASLRRPVDR